MNPFAAWRQKKPALFEPPAFIIRGRILERGPALFEVRFGAVAVGEGEGRQRECCLRASSANAARRLLEQGIRQLAEQIRRFGGRIRAIEYPEELELPVEA